MIHSLSKCLFLTIIAILTFGCNKEISEIFADLITGKWEWVETVYPLTGKVINPQTEGISMALEFSKEGLMKGYTNDSLCYSIDYRIEKYSTEPDKYELIFDSDLRAQFLLVEDSLFLNSAYSAYNGEPVALYVRID